MPHRLIAALLLLPSLLVAQGARLLRQPTISQTQVAFVYASDLWIVGRDGGEARRLTSFDGVEEWPHFSPDGKWVAFTGQYGGNRDVYVISADGGEPKRLTWHPDNDEVVGWTPDGSKILFSSPRYGPPTGIETIYAISPQGGMPEPLRIPRAWKGSLSPDGRSAAYMPYRLWDIEWRNYHGGQAGPIWIQNLETGALEKTPGNGYRQMDPVWLSSGIYFISEQDNAANVYRYDPATKAVTQLTKYRDFDAKHLAGGGGALTYDQGGYIHVLDPATQRDKQLVITIHGDLPLARSRWIDLKPQSLTHASLSPSGARALFEARGEIFTIPAEKGDYRNLTRSPGAADRNPVWSPDGKQIAWFSDQSGEYQLMVGSPDGLTPPRAIPLPGSTFYFTPTWSPDSKNLAFTDVGLNLYSLNVATGTATKIDTDNYMVPNRTVNPRWSPDSKWIAYSKRLDNQYHVVMVHSLKDGKNYQVTDGLSDAQGPAWDASGKYLYFLASTDFALNTGWLDMSSYDRPVRNAVYVVVLRATDPSPFLPESDEENGAPEPAKPAPKPDSAAAAVPPSAVQIDFPGISQRILALQLPPRNYVELVPGKAGFLFIAEPVPNQPGFTALKYDLKKRTPTPFLTGLQDMSVSADGSKFLYRSGPVWGIVPTEGPPPKVGDGKLQLALKMYLDPKAEWSQIFHEGWRLQRDFLYVPNVHGNDWPAIWKMYEPWVASVGHRNDLNALLDILGGEVSVGHSFVFGGDMPDVPEAKVGLLGADFTVDQGRYRIQHLYTGENWNPELRAPLSEPGVNVAQGDYLLAVNGVELRAPTSVYSLFEGTAGRQTVLRVNSRPTLDGSREVTVVPVESEVGLRSRAWVEGNRRMVDSLSGGKLAYVWIPNTAGAGYTYFNRYYFAQQQKEGAILDERFNGGGSVADYIIDVATRKLHGYFNNPVGARKMVTEPIAGIWGPKVMLANESAGSGGDMLPFMFKQSAVGPLIGTKTWGGLVGIWDAPQLIDGGLMTAPRGGFVNLKGQWDVEDVGVTPDIVVEQTPREVLAGHDPQLERAVTEAMRMLKENPVKVLRTEPTAPIRAKRPAP
ncbi:MAG: PDZ domain-containing protein [Gemmatimonadota bacterium]